MISNWQHFVTGIVSGGDCCCEWGVAHFADDLNDFLRTPEIEAVIIATPPDSHAEIALSCIDRGLHVCLKADGAHCRECDQIVSKAREKTYMSESIRETLSSHVS